LALPFSPVTAASSARTPPPKHQSQQRSRNKLLQILNKKWPSLHRDGHIVFLEGIVWQSRWRANPQAAPSLTPRHFRGKGHRQREQFGGELAEHVVRKKSVCQFAKNGK
jgi:hypothetical protein